MTKCAVMHVGYSMDIYLDYCKAFDSVPRKRIIMKFSCSCGIVKHSVASVASLLSDKEMRVTAKQQESAWVSVGRVSRGSVLAPLLFLGERCTVWNCHTLYTTEQDDQLWSLIKDAEESFDVQ